MTFNCSQCLSKCKAQCCMAYCIPEKIYDRNKHKIVREVFLEIRYTNGFIMPNTTDKMCPFLNYDLSCNIYDDRPEKCQTFGSESGKDSEESLDTSCAYQDSTGRIRRRQEHRLMEKLKKKRHEQVMKKIDKYAKETGLYEQLDQKLKELNHE